MTIKEKKTAGETATNLWEDGVDITKPAPNRPYKKWLEIGVLVYLTKEQYESLMEEEWQEKRERYLQNRCQVSAQRGGLKRCTENCMNYKGEGRVCPWFMHKKANGGIVSLDELYESSDYLVADSSYQEQEDVLEHEEKIKKYRELVDKLEDETDRKIIELLKKEFSERAIAKELGDDWNQMKVNRRKNKIFDELRSKLKDF